MRDRQPTVSIGSVKGSNKTSEILSREHYRKRHWGKYWKLTKGFFWYGSLEHFARECQKIKVMRQILCKKLPQLQGVEE